MRALALLLLAGCAGLPAPTPETLEKLRPAFPPPPGPYVRVRATVGIDSSRFAGEFQALLVAKTGRDPVVRLQLLPDVGPKVLDLVASRQRITGWFPQTGEKIDVSLPSGAIAHPIVLFGLTLLERFADAEGRVLATDGAEFTLKPVSSAVEVSGGILYAAITGHRVNRSLRFRGPSGAAWTWTSYPESVDAPGFRLDVGSWSEERLDRLDESLLRLELPVDSR